MTAANEEMKQPKILVVDDNEAVRTSLRAVLEANNFLITTATNVNNALHLSAHESFDVLLSDLHMPGPGGAVSTITG